jgi:short-subunit dehydrogenase
VINNAGVGYRFVELAEDDKIDQIVNVNLLGVVKCAGLIPVFRSQNKVILLISSIAGLVNLPFGSFYHATKHGVESFSECMAYELDFNISVATVQFGNTPSNSKKCNQIKTIYQPV